MSIKVVVDGESFAGLADGAWKEERARLRGKVTQARDLVLNEIKRLLRIRTGPTAAPAGEPPARQAGDLLRSLRRIRPRVTRTMVSAGLEVRDPAANRQEFGGVDNRGIRVNPHPYVRPAFEKMTPEVDRLLGDG